MNERNRNLLSEITLWLTSAVLIFSAATKFKMVLSEPIVPANIFEAREFVIVQTVLITGLAIWLVCGIFRKAGWLLAVIAFIVFTLDSLYKGLSGAASCGCFGGVTVNPWITVFAINLPVLILLTLFRPQGEKLLPPPWPNARHLVSTALPTALLIASVSWTMVHFEPPAETEDYLYVEEEKWEGEYFEYLYDISIADQLAEGLSIMLFYHNDCPNCREAIPVYEEFNQVMQASGQDVKVAFIHLPSQGSSAPDPVPQDTTCLTGEIVNQRQWLTATPLVIVTEDGTVLEVWENEVPMDLDKLLSAVFG
ncbi:hypothetical protein L21SP3_01157 [Sedimentisphaera cyanobacteriorum]|uniref:Methylamine utilisation protein MauE domain-containing protein n=1 Tax=Sedimentisphaera cyanobacteriorum TaxID=1940790 RepID=A0A1Q2HQ39_9BACT|nr:MauE/DoxX family redox-associated membrane protein [Sedimentisphaera cyanobacteriorum]AQQ09353.1 hypothetical protein L21SP3_01157 [Sedimentisphaera cyanobacteriorum]